MKTILFVLSVFAVGFCSAQSADSYYKKAIELKNNKEYSNALDQMDLALKLDSTNTDYLSEESEDYIDLKMYQPAYDALTKAISINPTKSILYNYRGGLLLSVQQFDSSIADYTKGMDIAENDSLRNIFLVNRGSAKIYERDFKGAYKDLMKAYEYDSSDLAMLTDLASICDEVGKGDQTLRYLLRAIKIKPDFYPAYGNIGFKYQDMGDYKTAIKYFNKVLVFNPDEPLGYSNRSYCEYKLGDLKTATDDINKSISLYDTNSYAYRIRALIYIQEKKTDDACEDLQKALDLGFTTTYGNEVETLKKTYCK